MRDNGWKKDLKIVLNVVHFSYLRRVGFCLRSGRPPVGAVVSQLEEAIRKRRGGWSAGLGGVVRDSFRCSSCGRSRDRGKDEESLVQSVGEHGEGFERKYVSCFLADCLYRSVAVRRGGE